MTNTPEIFDSILSDNLRSTQFFAIAQELILEARSLPAEKLERLESRYDEKSAYADKTQIIEMIANSMISLDIGEFPLSKILTISTILYKSKGTAKALQFAFDSLDVPFFVVDSATVNADPAAYGLSRTLECEILIQSNDLESDTLSEDDIKKVKAAFDLFGWICVDPLFLLNKVFEENISLGETFAKKIRLGYSSQLFVKRLLSDVCPTYPDPTEVTIGEFTIGGTGDQVSFLHNLAQAKSFTAFEGEIGEGDSVRILPESVPFGRFADPDFSILIRGSVWGAGNCVVCSYGDDDEPVFLLYVEDSRLILRAFSDVATYVDYVSPKPLHADRENSFSVRWNLVRVDMDDQTWYGTTSWNPQFAGYWYAGGAAITGGPAYDFTDLVSLTLVLDRKPVYESGKLVAGVYREDCLIIGRGIVSEMDAISDWYLTGDDCPATAATTGSRISFTPYEDYESWFRESGVENYLTFSTGPDPGDLIEVATDYFTITGDALTDPFLEEIDSDYATFSAFSPVPLVVTENMWRYRYDSGMFALQSEIGVSGAFESFQNGWLKPVTGTVSDTVFGLYDDYLQVENYAAWEAERDAILYWQDFITGEFSLDDFTENTQIYLSNSAGIGSWNVFLGSHSAGLTAWQEAINASSLVTGTVTVGASENLSTKKTYHTPYANVTFSLTSNFALVWTAHFSARPETWKFYDDDDELIGEIAFTTDTTDATIANLVKDLVGGNPRVYYSGAFYFSELPSNVRRVEFFERTNLLADRETELDELVLSASFVLKRYPPGDVYVFAFDEGTVIRSVELT